MASRAATLPILLLLWNRLGRAKARFAALARNSAGCTRKRCPRRNQGIEASNPQTRPRTRWPRGHAWLVRQVPDAAAYGSQLQHLLSDPEMAALIAATPQAGRILRPLCRMLGVPPIPALLLPPKPPAADRPARPLRTPPEPRRPAAPSVGKPAASLGSFRLARLFAPL